MWYTHDVYSRLGDLCDVAQLYMAKLELRFRGPKV